MSVDLLQYIDYIPKPTLRHRLLDQWLDRLIPFNRGLGFRIEEFSPRRVKVSSPERKRRRNHLGSAHACALALVGEYTAGLLVAQNFSPERYRLIMSQLHMEYKKQGRGALSAEATPPKTWPHFEDGIGWIDMKTSITDTHGEEVAICSTKWQLKVWQKVRTPKK